MIYLLAQEVRADIHSNIDNTILEQVGVCDQLNRWLNNVDHSPPKQRFISQLTGAATGRNWPAFWAIFKHPDEFKTHIPKFLANVLFLEEDSSGVVKVFCLDQVLNSLVEKGLVSVLLDGMVTGGHNPLSLTTSYKIAGLWSANLGAQQRPTTSVCVMHPQATNLMTELPLPGLNSRDLSSTKVLWPNIEGTRLPNFRKCYQSITKPIRRSNIMDVQ